MAQAVTMPALGESVTEGTVTTWLKQVGDTVEVDEPIVEVSTDKVDSEVPSPVAGTITEILVEEDETVEVGTKLCMVGDADEVSSDSANEAVPVEQERQSQDSTSKPQQPSEESAAADEAEQDAGEMEGTSGKGTEIRMPALGESVTEGTVTSWLKSVGDKVEADEPLLEVSTDKVDSEVPSPVAGYLTEILVNEDETVDVGTVVAIVSDSTQGGSSTADKPTEQVPAKEVSRPSQFERESKDTPPAAPQEPKEASPQAQDEAKAEKRPQPVASKTTGTYVTPLVRKLAKEHNVDLNDVKGTGIGGRIQREDVLEAARQAEQARQTQSVSAEPTANKPAAAAITPDTSLRGTTQKMTRLRQTIAKRMHASLQESAQLTTVIEVDVTKVAALRARAKDEFAKREGTKLTFLPFFVKAATEALKVHPKLNAALNGNEVTYFDHEHIGIAVDTPRGLLVPVIKNAGDLTISGLAKSINDLAARTRDASIGADQLSGSTFTITNTGSGGALFDTPVLNAPEVGILGVGSIVKRPMVVKDADGNETIGIRSMVYLALSYDHQLVDGADAARYLMTVKKRLEDGEFEGELGL